jgi:hypothetical protein
LDTPSTVAIALCPSSSSSRGVMNSTPASSDAATTTKSAGKMRLMRFR